MKIKIILTVLTVIFTETVFQVPVIRSEAANHQYKTIIFNDLKNIVDHAKNIVEGEIVKIEKKFKSDIPIWEVTMISSGGGKILIEISDNNPKLLHISAPEGPYNYSVNSGYNLISFTDAKNASEAYTGEAVLKWVLKEHNGKWEYNFWHFTKTGRAQVRVDAETGQIITKKTKNKKINK